MVAISDGPASTHIKPTMSSQLQLLSQQFRTKVELPGKTLGALADSLGQQMAEALSTPDGSLTMYPTMVHVLPTGHEEGEFFAIDIGGTNFRVSYVKLSKDKSKLEDHLIEECNIPEECYTCHADELFLWMARTHLKFAEKHGRRVSRNKRPIVGFCFSFPCEHHALAGGRWASLTKGFANAGAVGVDPVAKLTAAYERLGQPMQVACMVNDTVATLCAARYFDPRACIGLILGTGTNACCVEPWAAIGKLPAELALPQPLPHRMVVNTEWGFFRLEGLMESTAEDDEVDAGTCNPGLQALEKRIGGKFMGQIADARLTRLDRFCGLLGGAAAGASRGPFLTCHLAACMDDVTPDLSATAEALQEAYGLAPGDVGAEARAQVKEVCELVACRGARLTAAALTALIRRAGAADDSPPTLDDVLADDSSTLGAAAEPPGRAVVVAVDGGLYSHFAGFRAALRGALEELLGLAAAARVELIAVDML